MTKAWFEDANRMAPDELVNVTFPLSRLGRRGYEEDPVRKFLGNVHDEFMRLVKERTDLWQEVQRLRRRFIAGNTGGDPQAALAGEADAELAPLRRRSDVYRAHLRAHTEEILREIEEWERSEAASFPDAPQLGPVNVLPEVGSSAFLHH